MPAPPLLVVGCPRSGTSLFAKLLVRAGLRSVRDERASSKYPAGYFEHLPLLMFHKAMERFPRRSTNRADFVPTTEPFLKAEYLKDPFAATMFAEAFRPVLRREVDFIKYPQLALSVDFLFDALGDVAVVAVWRQPEATVASLVQKEFGRGTFPFRGLRAVMLWNTYAHHICAAKARHGDRVRVVSIDRVVEGGGDPVGVLLRGLGYDAPPVRVSDEIDPGLWTRRPPLRSRAYVRLLDGLTSRLGGRLADEAPVADLGRWARRLEAISEPAGGDGR